MLLMSIVLAASLTAEEQKKPTWYAVNTNINKCVDTHTLKMKFANTPQHLADTIRKHGMDATVEVLHFDDNGNPSVVTVTAKWSEGHRTQYFFSTPDLCNQYLAAAKWGEIRSGPIQKSFGDGTYVIGKDILPGTYKSSGGSFCYYARLSGFSGSDDDDITSDIGRGSAVVTIEPTDKGFKTDGCGTWTPLK